MKKYKSREIVKPNRLSWLVGAVAVTGLLAGCGGDPITPPDEGSVTTTEGVKSGTVHSITISEPFSNAIVDLTNGVYRRKLSISLRDREGLPLPDGTKVSLRVIDSIIAEGSIIAGGTSNISGTTLTIPGAEQSDGTAIADLSTVTVNRFANQGGQLRAIEPGDYVLLFNNALTTDIARFISSDAIQANSLNVTQAYSEDYPDYSSTNYLVGASMLSAGISGEDASGNLTPGEVFVSGGTGVATAWIIYSSGLDSIMTGCNPGIDTRISPMGSGQVYVVASAGGLTNFKSFCFSPIAGFELTAFPESLRSIRGGSANATVCAQDGGDGVPVPFAGIGFGQTAGELTAAVSVSGGSAPGGNNFTNEGGCFGVTFTDIQGPGGQTGTWSFQVGDGTVDISIEIPEDPEEEAVTP